MRSIIPILLFIVAFYTVLPAQNRVEGEIEIDTTWSPIVYLSIITDLADLNKISGEMILEKADIDPSGRFSINTDFLPAGDNLYRIHIARRNDPPASLIIGGRDENHFFLIINKNYPIRIRDTTRSEFIKDAIVEGYAPNRMLYRIDEIASFLDSVSFEGYYIKTELIRNAVHDKLRFIADTCSNSLVSLYALYKSDFEKNYPVNKQFYKDYLQKWKKERSNYFAGFRKKIRSSDDPGPVILVLFCMIFFISGILAAATYLKYMKKERSPIHELSVQERKIFALIAEGKSNKEISESLNIGLSTVKSHINNIYTKLGINSRKDILNLDLEQKDKA